MRILDEMSRESRGKCRLCAGRGGGRVVGTGREAPLPSPRDRPGGPSMKKRTKPVPNLTLGRSAQTGKPTEDELLLQRPKRERPQPRVPENAAFTREDPWRVLRIMGEFVHGFDALAELGAAVT